MKKAILLALLGGVSLIAGPCTSAPLSTYTTTGFTCTLDQFTFKDFFFGVGATSLGYSPIGASSITVRPTINTSASGDVLGLDFSSTGFSVNGSQFVNYEIRYNVDPPPDIIIEMDDQLNSNTPVAPGFANVNTNLCVGGKWTSPIVLSATKRGGPSNDELSKTHPCVAISRNIGIKSNERCHRWRIFSGGTSYPPF